MYIQPISLDDALELSETIGWDLDGGFEKLASFARKTEDVLRVMAQTAVLYNSPQAAKQSALGRVTARLFEKTAAFQHAIAVFDFPKQDVPALFKTVRISDPAALSAAAGPDAQAGVHLIQVDALAQSQVNYSRALAADETTQISDGDYILVLTVDGREHAVKITVDTSGDDPDTNREIADRLAFALATADQAVGAEIKEARRSIYDENHEALTEAVVQLKVFSKATGADAGFSISDQTGDLARQLGLDRVFQQAKNSDLVWDGTRLGPAENSMKAENGRISVTLLDSTKGLETIRIQKGPGPVLQAATSLIRAYNTYAQWVADNRVFLDSELETRMNQVVENLESNLDKIGLNTTSSGQIEITEGFFSAMQSQIPMVRESLFGESGLFPKLDALLSRVLENSPQAYQNKAYETFSYNDLGMGNRLLSGFKTISSLNLLA